MVWDKERTDRIWRGRGPRPPCIYSLSVFKGPGVSWCLCNETAWLTGSHVLGTLCPQTKILSVCVCILTFLDPPIFPFNCQKSEGKNFRVVVFDSPYLLSMGRKLSTHSPCS